MARHFKAAIRAGIAAAEQSRNSIARALRKTESDFKDATRALRRNDAPIFIEAMEELKASDPYFNYSLKKDRCEVTRIHSTTWAPYFSRHQTTVPGILIEASLDSRPISKIWILSDTL